MSGATKGELASLLHDHLVARKAIACELGTFFVLTYAAHEGRNPRTGGVVQVPAKHVPRYVPSDAFLARACGPSAVTRADHLAELARDVVGLASVTTRERPHADPNDEDEVIVVPPPDVEITIGELWRELADELGTRGKLGLSGLGTFTRIAWKRGPLRGRSGLGFAPSPVLTTAMSPRP